MVDPAALYDRPDTEAHVWSQLKTLPGTTSFAYSAGPLPAPAGWLVATSLQVDTWGPTKQAAYQRAVTARRRLLCLPSAVWADGVVTGVAIVEDCSWRPDPDGTPRYTARYEVTAHPLPAMRKENAA